MDALRADVASFLRVKDTYTETGNAPVVTLEALKTHTKAIDNDCLRLSSLVKWVGLESEARFS